MWRFLNLSSSPRLPFPGWLEPQTHCHASLGSFQDKMHKYANALTLKTLVFPQPAFSCWFTSVQNIGLLPEVLDCEPLRARARSFHSVGSGRPLFGYSPSTVPSWACMAESTLWTLAPQAPCVPALTSSNPRALVRSCPELTWQEEELPDRSASLWFLLERNAKAKTRSCRIQTSDINPSESAHLVPWGYPRVMGRVGCSRDS